MKYACSDPEHAGRRYLDWERIKCYLPKELRLDSSSTVPDPLQCNACHNRRRKASQAHEAAQSVQRSTRAAVASYEASAPPRPYMATSELLRLGPQHALPSKRVQPGLQRTHTRFAFEDDEAPPPCITTTLLPTQTFITHEADAEDLEVSAISSGNILL